MRKILIVIDMQNDFIDGTLGTLEAQAIVPNVKKKIEEYKARGDEIIFTRDTHFDNYLETNEGKHLPVEHCLKYSEGCEVTDEIDIKDCKHIDKETFGHIGWWFTLVGEEEIESIEIVGVCTSICVVSNALIIKAQFPEIDITVDASCCACVTPESHKTALEAMKLCQINII